MEVRAAGNKGRGVFALKDFARGQVVVIGKPLVRVPERTWETLQMGIDHHIKISEPFERINHSCDPNCGIQPNQWGGYNLVAMRPIVTGEEIVYDYCMSEWVSIAIPGECQCGTSLCSGSVRGGQSLSQQALSRYAGFLAPYYAELLRDRYPAPSGDRE